MKTLFFSIVFCLSLQIVLSQQRNLDFYITQAKTNSPLLNKNRNDNKLINLDLAQVKRALSKPEINLEVNVLFAPIIAHNNNSNSLEWISSGATNYSGYDLSTSDGGQYQALVAITQPLFNGSRFQAFSNKSAVLSQQNENSTVLTIHEIEQLVGYQYVLCLKSKMQVENGFSLITALKSQLPIMQKLVESALYKQSDLILLQLEIQNYEFDYQTFLANHRTNIYDLNLLCGINDTTIFDIQQVDFQIISLFPTTSKFLNSFKLDSLNVVSDLTISNLKYKPQLSLFANAGLNAVYQPTFNRLGFSTGITFSWNLFDGNQRGIQYQKSLISLQTIEFQKNNFITQNEINRSKILDQINSLNQQTSLLQEQLNQYNKLRNTYEKELSQGEISVMDFKNFMKDVASKQQQFLMLKIEKLMLINSYNYWNF